MRRRDFLGTSIAGSAGLLLADTMARAADSTDPVGLVPLGKHLKVCRLGAGTGMRGWNRSTNQTRLGKEKFEALLHHEYDQGVRLFDCADLYGSHPFVGRVLQGKPREGYQIVTKLWVKEGGLPEKERPDADVCIKRFLKELDMEYLDLVQFHCMTSGKWPEELRKQMDILDKLKEQGLVRAHGVSCHSVDALKAAASEPWVDVIHVRINPFKVSTDAAMDEVMPLVKQAHDAGKGIIGMKLNGEGRFTPEQRAESVRFALASGAVDVIIAGFETGAQVDEFKTMFAADLAAAPKKGG
ncbi:MAG: aldo/keto reductase [Planctomycetota bacterium]|nr:aldo/keto reductase [Planctomycetota bacterium]